MNMPELLHDLLTKSAGQYPDKLSIKCRGQEISYGRLDGLSSRLSVCLEKKGAGTGDRIGIYMDKSIEAVVSIFGILKSGSCYVPLDPLAPAERQSLIINDCAFEYLITSSKKLPAVRQILQNTKTLKYIFVPDISKDECKVQLSGVDVIFKDEIFKDSSASGQAPKSIPDSNLAYILYTSGSTGQPKGVMLSHKAALAFVDWAWKCFNVTSGDIVSSHAPFHFDLSVFDIFTAVKAGATLCIVPHELSSFPISLRDFIEKEKISVWYSVPSILTQMVLYGGLEEKKLPALRQVLFAGEVFPSKYLRRLMELLPDAKYCNLYGPTETNVITYYHVTEPPDAGKSIPIGAPCGGVKVFVVSESGVLVNDGEMGELYVSAPTLMDGYWNDSKKTESVLFKKPPFHPAANEIIYKTGDLVNFNGRGILEYHGRCDSMIKSRGYRIEIGEIETALSAHPNISETVVLGIPDDEIGTKIKAVIVLKDKSKISENEIKHFCSLKLPHYMIPEIVSFTDYLPRTSTGKIDRKKLERESI